MPSNNHNTKCVHATGLVIHEYKGLRMVHMLCTGYCQQPYWMCSDAVVGREISAQEALRRIMEVDDGRPKTEK
jgi:hypothetical protein